MADAVARVTRWWRRNELREGSLPLWQPAHDSAYAPDRKDGSGFIRGMRDEGCGMRDEGIFLIPHPASLIPRFISQFCRTDTSEPAPADRATALDAVHRNAAVASTPTTSNGV